MRFAYKPEGVCSSKIDFELDNGKLHNVRFTGGCPGYAKGISALLEGMDVFDAVSKLKGTRCGPKPTSCPDQLACALEEALQQQKEKITTPLEV